MIKYLMLIVFTMLTNPLFSQKNWNVKALVGHGFFEGNHAGLACNINNYSIGFSYGELSNRYPCESGKAKIYMLNNSLYFGGINRYDFKTSYLCLNLRYLFYDKFSKSYKLFPINPGIGKEFYLSKKIGVDIKGGFYLIFLGQVTKKVNDYDLGFWIYPVMPNLAVSVFFRIP